MILEAQKRQVFNAIKDVNKRAWKSKNLLSCPVLSKAPSYGDIFDNFQKKLTLEKKSPKVMIPKYARYFISNTLHIFYLLTLKIILLIQKWELPTLVEGEKKRYIISTFALLPKLIEDKKYKERYLPGLADAIKDEGGLCLEHLNFYGTRNPIKLWQAVKILKKNKQNFTYIHLLKFSDGLQLIKHLFCYIWEMKKIIASLKNSEEKSPEYYIYHALLENIGICIMPGEVARLGGKRLASWLKKGRIICWYENQTINKCLFAGITEAKKENKTKDLQIDSIGAQLLIWPSELLNNYPDPWEAKMGLMPDKVLVNGKFFLPSIDTQPCQYAIGPSLRYKNLYKLEKKISEKKVDMGGRIKILCLLSYHEDESRKVLALIEKLDSKHYDIKLRFHPAGQNKKLINAVTPRYKISQDRLYNELWQADLALGAGSGSLAEAVAIGTPALTLKGALNYLPPFGKGFLWEEIKDAREMESKAQRLLDAKGSVDYLEIQNNFKNLLFTKPSPALIKTSFID